MKNPLVRVSLLSLTLALVIAAVLYTRSAESELADQSPTGETVSATTSARAGELGQAAADPAAATSNKLPSGAADLLGASSASSVLTAPDQKQNQFEKNYFAAPAQATNLEQEALDRSISKLIGDGWVGASEIVEGTWQEFPAHPDGSYAASFKTLDGTLVYHFFNTEGRLQEEQIDFGDQGKLTKWFAYGPDRDNIVQFDRGTHGVQRIYYSNSQRRSAQFWKNGETKASMYYE